MTLSAARARSLSCHDYVNLNVGFFLPFSYSITFLAMTDLFEAHACEESNKSVQCGNPFYGLTRLKTDHKTEMGVSDWCRSSLCSHISHLWNSPCGIECFALYPRMVRHVPFSPAEPLAITIAAQGFTTRAGTPLGSPYSKGVPEIHDGVHSFGICARVEVGK